MPSPNPIGKALDYYDQVCFLTDIYKRNSGKNHAYYDVEYHAALKGSPKGSNLTAISLANRLKDLGITQEPEIRRIVDIMTNPNSLYGTKSGRQPVNPYVCG
jgi:hypothetical protein